MFQFLNVPFLLIGIQFHSFSLQLLRLKFSLPYFFLSLIFSIVCSRFIVTVWKRRRDRNKTKTTMRWNLLFFIKNKAKRTKIQRNNSVYNRFSNWEYFTLLMRKIAFNTGNNNERILKIHTKVYWVQHFLIIFIQTSFAGGFLNFLDRHFKWTNKSPAISPLRTDEFGLLKIFFILTKAWTGFCTIHAL